MKINYRMYPFFSFEQRLEEPPKHLDLMDQKSWTLLFSVN